MKSLTFIIPQEARKPFVATVPQSALSGAPTRTTPQARMSDREVDQQLVEKAQRGDKQAFELLVIKYQRKLERLLSRVIRDPAEIEDVAQEAFIKAYRALPDRHQYREELPHRPRPACADVDGIRQRGSGRLRGCHRAARH